MITELLGFTTAFYLAGTLVANYNFHSDASEIRGTKGAFHRCLFMMGFNVFAVFATALACFITTPSIGVIVVFALLILYYGVEFIYFTNEAMFEYSNYIG